MDIQFKLRLPADLHARLEDAASRSGISLTQEIVQRLEQSLPRDLDLFRLEGLQRELGLKQLHLHRLRALVRFHKEQMTPAERKAAQADEKELAKQVERLQAEVESMYELLR